MAQVFKNAGIEAARQVGESSAMDEAADVVLSAAKARAAQSRVSGDYLDSLQTATVKGQRDVKDREVYSDDPAALSIEFGHMSGARGSADRKWVPGKFILTQAAQEATS